MSTMTKYEQPPSIAGKLRRHLWSIRDLWDEMLEPTGKRPGSASGGSLDDDHEVEQYATLYEAALASAPDVPRTAQIIDVRRQVTLSLNGWCRVVVEEHDVEHGIPKGHDVIGMCTFLDRWADRIEEHAAVDDLLEEVIACSSAVRRIARPSRPEGMVIGECRQVVGPGGEECTTVVRATTDYEERGEITCRGCSTTDTLEGWILRMVGSEGPYTAAQLVPILHRRMGIRATTDLIRQWDRREVIRPLRNGDGTKRTNAHGAVLYPWVATAKALADKGMGEKHAQSRV